MSINTATTTLLNAATGTGSSEWFNVADLDNKYIHIEMTASTGNVAQVMVSNETSQPDSSDDGPKDGSDVSAPTIVTISYPCRWVKVKVTTLGSGTVTAYVFGRKFSSAKVD